MHMDAKRLKAPPIIITLRGLFEERGPQPQLSALGFVGVLRPDGATI